jgi:hypothetical protein
LALKSTPCFFRTFTIDSYLQQRHFNPNFRLAITSNRRKFGKNCPEPSKNVAM